MSNAFPPDHYRAIAKSPDEEALALAMRRLQSSASSHTHRDDDGDGDDALMPPAPSPAVAAAPSPSVAAAAAAAAARFPSPAAMDAASASAAAAAAAARQSEFDEEEMDKLRPVLETVRKIKRLIASLPAWTDEDIPCVRATAEKLPTACTEEGYATIKKALKMKTAALDAESVSLQNVLHKYSKKLDEACKAKYLVREYRAELRATQKLRKDEKQERIEVQAEQMQHKMEHTRGFAERHAKKLSFKRKKLGTDETKEKTIFDL